MAWRESLIRHLGTGPYSGVTVGRWFRVLRENRFAIEPRYWLKACAITATCFPNTVVALLENALFGAKVSATTISPPIFILGIWRSGTTHLHNLFSKDDRFAYPNGYQVCWPTTFLLTERVHADAISAFLPKTRPQDNMAMGIREPQEDEFAFFSLYGHTPYFGWTFPRRAAHYDRYLTLREVSTDEIDQWKSALEHFVRKLAFKYGKPLVLKSPPHTGRIKLLLEFFPDARFVHIRRDPYAVFQSTRRLWRNIIPWFAMQEPDDSDLDERVLRQYAEVYRAFFEERPLIPEGRFHEVAFEDLDADPIGQMRAIYDALDLPAFETVEPALTQYVESLAGYKKNSFDALEPELRARIAREWRPYFQAWGYPT